MEIKVSEIIGFCFGVKQAVDLSKKALSKNKKSGKIFSVGPLIHNPQVVKELKDKGLTPLVDIEGLEGGTVIISSHGAGAKLIDKKKNKALRIIDATCPLVKKIQDRVKVLYRNGYKVVIIGKKTHPEVKALADFTDGKAVIVKDVEEAKKIKYDGSKLGVVSQSTYSQKTFSDIVSLLFERPFKEVKVFNTICKDTIRRQDAVRSLAEKTDIVIVVGGKESANTCRLAEVAREKIKDVYHIEDKSQIDPSWFRQKKCIGIASGASTPDWVVRGVIKRIGGIFKDGNKKQTRRGKRTSE